MLINCPKCGFSQPKDRYCASCGVDMDSFRPKPQPLAKQLFTNPAFLLALTLAIVMGSVIYIRKKQSEEIIERAQLIRSGPVIVDQDVTPTTDQLAAQGEAPPSPAPATETPPTMEVANAADAPSTGAMAAAPSATASPTNIAARTTATPPGTEKTPASIDRKVRLTATYAEVSQTALVSLLEESQATGQFTEFGEFRAGALPNVASRLRNLKVLQQIQKTFDAKTLQQQWFVGTKTNDDQDVGLTTMVILEPLQENRVRGEIEILRSFHEGDPSAYVPTKKTSPIMSFSLPARTGWMVFMELPTTPQRTSAEEFAPEGFLRIFESMSFKNGQSKFTLFLDFDNSAP